MSNERIKALESRVSDAEARADAAEGKYREAQDAFPSWVQGPGVVGGVLHLLERITELEAANGWLEKQGVYISKLELAARRVISEGLTKYGDARLIPSEKLRQMIVELRELMGDG